MDRTELERIWQQTLGDRDVGDIDPTETLRPVTAPDTETLHPLTTDEPTRTTDDALAETLPSKPTVKQRTLRDRPSDNSQEESYATTLQSGDVSSLRVPTAWGRWRGRRASDSLTILAEVGRGGMGVVYRARQESLHREVAVKQIIPEKMGPELVDRFVSESLITAMLDHPNIVPVHDLVQTAEGELCLAMKLIGGVSWSELLHPRSEDDRKRALQYDLKDHLGILRNVCNAIAFAHSRGIVHLDLKPSNVMVGEFGEVLVMDWGIAVAYLDAVDQDEAVPRLSDIVVPSGTPRYLAPEMAEGRGDLIGPWSDVFLLGGILHELLTGVPPHRGSDMYEILRAASLAEPPSFEVGVPDGLARICRKALARQPEDRYKDPSAFSAALGEYLEHRESQLIAERAERQLAESMALGGADLIERYAGFAEAVAGFKQALHLWAGNEAASEGRNRAAIAYAEAALDAGDLALAASQADSIDEQHPVRATLVPRVEAAQAQAAKAQRHQRMLRRSLAAAVLLIIGGLTIGTMLIDQQRQRAERARGAEASARHEAESQRQAAVEARDRAERSEVAAQHEAWRMRLANAKALYDLGIERLAAGGVDEAGASFLAAYETAPVDRIPPGFEPDLGGPDHAAFAWRALHLRHLEQAADRRLVFPQIRVVRDIAISSRHVLYVAGDAYLTAIDLNTDRALWALPLPCRHMVLDDARQQLVVNTSDDQPPLLIDLASGVQQRLPYERRGDFTFLFHHPREAQCSAWDQRNKALVTWELDPISIKEDRVFTEKYPIAMHYKAGGLEWYENPRPPTYPDMWTSYSVELDIHEDDIRPIFRSPDRQTRVVVRTRPGSILAELRENPWGVDPESLRVFPGPDGKFPSNRLRFGHLADNGRLALWVKDRLHLLDLRMDRVIDGRPMPFARQLRQTTMAPDGSILAYALRPEVGHPGVFIVTTRASNLGKARAVWSLVEDGDGLRMDLEPVADIKQAFTVDGGRHMAALFASTHIRHLLAVSERKGDQDMLHVWHHGEDRSCLSLPIPPVVKMTLYAHSAGDGRCVAIEYERGGSKGVSRQWIDSLDNPAVEDLPEDRRWTYPSDRETGYEPAALWFVDVETGGQHFVEFRLPPDAPARQGGNKQTFHVRGFPGEDLILCYDGAGIVALSADGRRGVRLEPPAGVDLQVGRVSWSSAGDAVIFQTLALRDEALRLTYDRAAIVAALAQVPVNEGERIDMMQVPSVGGCLVHDGDLVFQRRPIWFRAAPDAEFALLCHSDRSLSWVSGRTGEVVWRKLAVRGQRAAIDPTGHVTIIWNQTDDRVQFIDNDTGAEFAVMDLEIPTLFGGKGSPSLIWSADGGRLMVGHKPSGHVIDLFAPSVQDPSPASGSSVLKAYRERAACDVGRAGANWGQVDRQAKWIDLEQVGPLRIDSL